MRDFPARHCFRAIPAVPHPSLEQQFWQGLSQGHTEMAGKLLKPRCQPLSHTDLVFREQCTSLWHIAVLWIKAKSEGLGALPGRQSPVVDLVPVSSLQVHGHETAKGTCLGASHALSVHTHSFFQGLPAYNLTWKGKLGACQGSSELLVFCLKINLAED